MKVVTICGSMRFANEMIKISQTLETKLGYCVIQCVYELDKQTLDDEKAMKNIVDAHFKKIDISYAIYVLNIDGYIGKPTRR